MDTSKNSKNRDKNFFKTPTEVFEKQLDELFSRKSDSEIDTIFRIVSLVINNDYSNNTDLRDLYRVIDLESFVKVVSIFENRSVKFPSKNSVKESLMLALCYYYKEIEGWSWEQIKNSLPFDISSISYGIRIKSLDRFLINKINELVEELHERRNSK